MARRRSYAPYERWPDVGIDEEIAARAAAADHCPGAARGGAPASAAAAGGAEELPEEAPEAPEAHSVADEFRCPATRLRDKYGMPDGDWKTLLDQWRRSTRGSRGFLSFEAVSNHDRQALDGGWT